MNANVRNNNRATRLTRDNTPRVQVITPVVHTVRHALPATTLAVRSLLSRG